MKRYRIVNKFRFTAFVTVCILLLTVTAGSILGVFDARAAQPREFTTVTVQSGDTLWNLARVYGPEHADVRDVISDICRINEISDSCIHPGQVLLIPTNM
ncbi:MAG: LysM peptidoglycan-binding domain-containing protein [Firmicutes bacterium]|nr:LysM peptidoglycan-binding domain-containing protein [Bacillota bacterium]